VDRNGNRTAYSYGDDDNDGHADDLESIVDPVGRSTTLAYANGHLLRSRARMARPPRTPMMATA